MRRDILNHLKRRSKVGLLRWKRTTVIKELPAMTNLEETSLVVADKNLAITKNTPYEELVKKIKSDPVNLKRDIFREIMSAYCYLRVVLEMHWRAITLEEFITIQKRIENLAMSVKINDPGHCFSSCRHFLAHKYFKN